MKKAIVLLIVIPALLVAGLFGYVLYQGPRMTVQHHVRDFQMIMPAGVPGTATVVPPVRLPSEREAAGVGNPLRNDAEGLRRGKVYYSYYCAFCHGDSGAGDGPVGQSYSPVPADLRSGKVAAYNDGALLRSMLTGIGHEPVLEQVIAPQHRWYLVLFVRSLRS